MPSTSLSIPNGSSAIGASREKCASLAHALISLPPGWKTALVVFADIVVTILAAACALGLAVLPERPAIAGEYFLLVLAPAISIPALFLTGVYSAVVRFVSIGHIVKLVRGFCFSLLLLGAIYAVIGVFEQSWNLLALCGLLSCALAAFLRFGVARFLQSSQQNGSRDRVLIYGAGAAGTQLAAALLVNSCYRPVAFVDDRADLQGRAVMNLPVYAPEQLDELREDRVFDRVLLAIPRATRRRLREILENLERLAVRVQVMPSLSELASGRRRVDELRDVQIEDLLDRDPVLPIERLINQCIRDQVVLVTGAGGSIGSELCRQALQHGARKLVLFDASEFALYNIERELRVAAGNSGCDVVPILGNVTMANQIQQVLSAHGVGTIYHAAAYKHVPLVEQNSLSAVYNNVLGTLNTLQAAAAARVPHFVLVSTDKAVRPTNVMGASKRVCELIVQSLGAKHREMRTSIVRFGNVLASSGSVVPLFRKQIQSGGPVTVTHPDITRYFMTIPEAAQLVIQAGAMGRQGEVFILEMGEPVRITDLAQRLIRLTGLEASLQPDAPGDIAIEFTGLRPGEKLYEELLIGDDAERTEHPRIFRAREVFKPWGSLRSSLSRIERAVEAGNESGLIAELSELVEGFCRADRSVRPSEAIRPDIPLNGNFTCPMGNAALAPQPASASA